MENPELTALLKEKRKAWLTEQPFGFLAKPITRLDGSLDMMNWKCQIMGKMHSRWSNTPFKLTMCFTNEYPQSPPICKFDPPLYHPNVCASGVVHLPLLTKDQGWNPGLSIKDILVVIQTTFEAPNLKRPVNLDAAATFFNSGVPMEDEAVIELLNQKRKKWRSEQPFGFLAKPSTRFDGSLDMMNWKCQIMGKSNSRFNKLEFKLIMSFTNDYPSFPPICKFEPTLFHPNVSAAGVVHLPLLTRSQGWNPNFSIKDILLGIQKAFDAPDLKNPVNQNAATIFRYDHNSYEYCVLLAKRYYNQ